nr:MAG TPA: minor capsid protein [Caudoviricetes sp.]
MSDFDKEIAEIYKDMELKMIESMKRNLGSHLAEEDEAGIDYPQWQAIKIRELRKYQRHNKMLLKNSTRGMAKNVKDHIRDEMKQGSLHEMKRFKEAKGAGYKSAVAMKDGFFKINTRKVDALINSVQSDFSRADKAVLRMMNDTYRSTIFKYGMYVTNGVYTEKQAYDAAVKDFLSRGINCIEYKDGRRVNIADYTSMAIRTVNQRAYMAGEGEFRKELGETLVIISKHATSCKLCKPFENKVLIDDVYSGGTPDDGDYMLLSQAMAEGLFHPRCRHGLGTYYPELEDIVHYETEDNKLNEYGTEELNRAHVENMIQKYKRLTVGSIDPDNIAKYQARLNEWEKRKTEIKSNPAAETVDIETKKYYNLSTDREQFSRYKATLKELFPSKFEDFQKIKYGDPELWKSLKAKYRIVNQYKIDSGDLGVEEILRLDDVVITEKRTMFTSKFKKSGNIAGAYIDGDKSNMYFAHSRLSDSTKGYKGKSNLVLLKDKRRFSYIDVIDKDNSIRGETYQDTEAKLFEYFADLYEKKPFKSITMLSERGMCDSCKGVMKQFSKQYPKVQINVISNKKITSDVWKHRKR